MSWDGMSETGSSNDLRDPPAVGKDSGLSIHHPTAPIPTRWAAPAALVVLALSGAASLSYQVVWTRVFAAGLGSETPAVLAVVSAVMAGLGIGAWLADRPVSRSLHPDRWYAAFEWVIGGWGAVLALALPHVNGVAAAWIGLDPSPARHWFVCFALPCLILLPATAAMGATLPAMDRFLARRIAQRPWVGAVYAANTAGAASGVLLAAWLALPVLGLRAAALTLAGLNVLCGIAIAWMGRGGRQTLVLPPAARPNAKRDLGGWALDRAGNRSSEEAGFFCADAGQPRRRGEHGWTLAAVATGLLGIGFEVMGIRVLSQVLDNTVFTFASVLAVYLVGTASGAAAYQAWCNPPVANPVALLAKLLTALTLTIVAGIAALNVAVELVAFIRTEWGQSVPGVLGAELAVAATVFFAPTALMGATFSHLATVARTETGGVGKVFGQNALGGALAPFLFGTLLLPGVGVWIGLAAIALGYALLATRFIWRAPDTIRSRTVQATLLAAGIAGVTVLTVLAGPVLTELPQRAIVRRHQQGPLGFATVIEEPDGHRALRVDNRFQMGGTAAYEAQARQAHLALLLHPQPRRALFLGTGTGITLGAATLHPDLELEGVELLPEVVRLMPEFDPLNRLATIRESVQVHVADARRFLRLTPRSYDVIVADLFHPERDGTGLLYTLEHFTAGRARLQPGGLFCQWLPLHQLNERSLWIIVRTFLEVFPETELWWLQLSVDVPVLGLIGYTQPGGSNLAQFGDRTPPASLQAELEQLTIAEPIRVLGLRITGASRLASFASGSPINTDNLPRVTFTAPALRYEPARSVSDRVRRVLELTHLAEGITNLSRRGVERPLVERWQRYITARDTYLEGLIADASGRERDALQAWIESTRLSLDFTAGYAQVLSRAVLWRETRPAEVRQLLEALAAAQPTVPVARQLLDRLETEPRWP
jgi:spermidine synthase